MSDLAKLWGLMGGSTPVEDTELRITINMPANTTYALGVITNVNVDIDWGDGGAIENKTTNTPTHLYTNAGTYQVKVNGECYKLALSSSYLFSIDNMASLGAYDMYAFCYNAPNLVSVSGDTWVGTGVGIMAYAFSICPKLASVNLPKFVGADLTNYPSEGASASCLCMFENSPLLASINLDSFNPPNVYNINGMFHGTKLTTLSLPEFVGSLVVEATGTFGPIQTMTSINLPKFRGDNIVNAFGFMYWNLCTTINLPEFRGNNIENADIMFYYTPLQNLSIPYFTGTKITGESRMFLDTQLTVTSWSNILIQFATVSHPNNFTLNGDGTKHNSAAVAAIATLTADGITVIDGGLE